MHICGRLIISSVTFTVYLRSQPTPASAEWRQLWVKIGLLGHSSSLLAVEVHWTSSRKIGPLPAPKWALEYALPPVHTQPASEITHPQLLQLW